MGPRLLNYCKEEIDSLLKKELIRSSNSPWSCPAFYVENASEIERGAPKLVINYKPLNKALKWIKHPLPNKRDLLNRLFKGKIFSSFDLKSGFYQILLKEEDKYKTAFTVPFGLKNAPMEFQNIMNEIYNSYIDYIIVYIDDVLIYSDNIDQHFKHLNIFIQATKKAGLVVNQKN